LRGVEQLNWEKKVFSYVKAIVGWDLAWVQVKRFINRNNLNIMAYPQIVAEFAVILL